MGEQIRAHFLAQYAELAAHLASFDHTTPLKAEVKRLDKDGASFPTSEAAIRFFAREREREILAALKAAR